MMSLVTHLRLEVEKERDSKVFLKKVKSIQMDGGGVASNCPSIRGSQLTRSGSVTMEY